MKKIIINASNIHVGGGKVLMDELIIALNNIINYECVIFIDERFKVSKRINKRIFFYEVKPSLLDRYNVELKIKAIAKIGDIILYFGNLPPIIKNKGICLLFLQNRFIIDKYDLSRFKIKSRVRIFIERMIFTLKKFNCDYIIVQTESMKEILIKKYLFFQKILVMPFFSDDDGENLNKKILKEQKSFLYVTSTDPHKNNENLVLAWIYLASLDIFPKLYLTLEENESTKKIQKLINEFNLKIEFIGGISRELMLSYYFKCCALIYPSFFESFGLPLIEAKNRGVPIIASELDYVRDSVDPIETFDPKSYKSIARAVLRFLKYKNDRRKIVNAKKFLIELLTIMED